MSVKHSSTVQMNLGLVSTQDPLELREISPHLSWLFNDAGKTISVFILLCLRS